MKMSNKAYDIAKEIALTVLPVIGVVYFLISGIWDIPYGKEILGTIMIVDFGLGAILHISAKEYKESLNNITELKDAVLGGNGEEVEHESANNGDDN